MQHSFLATLVAKISGNGGAAIRAVAGSMVQVELAIHGNSRSLTRNQHVIHLIAKKHHLSRILNN
jgi:hypothetical protein